MENDIVIEQLTEKAFAPFGDIIDISGEPTVMINRGMCARHTDLARVDTDDRGRPGISIFDAKAYKLPLQLDMVERHPLGSQAFLPISPEPFLVIVALDEGGVPAKPHAFMTSPSQGVNYLRGVWHGVLTPLQPSRFFVIDRIGEGTNLEEHWFDQPYTVRQTGERPPAKSRWLPVTAKSRIGPPFGGLGARNKLGLLTPPCRKIRRNKRSITKKLSS